MAYPTSFGILPDVQALGALGVPVYSSAAQLALEQSVVQPGQMAAIINPNFTLVLAVGAQPSSYVATSTSSTQLAGGGVQVWWVGITSATGSATGAPNTARAVIDLVAAYNGSGTGTLTATTNGAMSATTFRSDTVTLAVGDQVFIQPGITHVTAKDSGPWVVVSLGASGSKWVVTRPAWFITGQLLSAAFSVKIGGEGAVYQNTTWRATAAIGTVVDTTDCAFYVERITFGMVLGGTGTGYQTASANQPAVNTDYPLTGGTATASACPVGIYSATKSSVLASLNTGAGTQTLTVSYGLESAVTPGYAGTAAFTVYGFKAGMVVTTDADTSTLNVTVLNF